jgi:hypothetical protein
LSSFIDDDFFKGTEADSEWCQLKPDDFQKRIGASYDLRSQYVHTGVSFGRWIEPRHDHAEIQTGKPVVSDKNFAKAIALAPTFIGMERVIRHCLIKLLMLNSVINSDDLKTLQNEV